MERFEALEGTNAAAAKRSGEEPFGKKGEYPIRSEAADVAAVEAVNVCGKIPTRSLELGDRRSECSATVKS